MVFCIWQNPNGNHNVPYLDNWSDKRKLNLNWLDNDWNENCRFLAFRKFLYSSASSGSFFFVSLIHPPSILPISSRSAETAMYLLLSTALICQAICRKNFAKSSLEFAFTRSGSFELFAKLADTKTSSIVSTNNKSIFAPSENRELLGK